jgi:rhodanese-related sulfurtransferase
MAVETRLPKDVFRLRRESGGIRMIDVRSPAEFAGVHAEGAELVPLDKLDPRAFASQWTAFADEPIYVICQSGGRAAKAVERFQEAGFRNVFSVAGGTAAWEKAGLPVIRGARTVLSLERQVRIVAGLLVLVGTLLGWQFHPAIHALSLFVGGGLLFAGVTDWCGMGLLLAKMPWNKPKQRGSAGVSACQSRRADGKEPGAESSTSSRPAA